MQQTRKMRGRGSLEIYYLERADNDRMWGPSIRWRPAKDEPLSGLTFRRLYLFNLPIYIVGMIVAVFLFSAMTGEDSPVTGSVPIWIAGAAITGALLDLIACLLLRRFWNRRARELGA